MGKRSQNWIWFLAAGVAASLSMGTHDATAIALPRVGLRVPPGQHDVLPAGHRHYYDYDDDDDDFDQLPDDYAPPPRPYGYVPPPASNYDPPVYGWLPPPRPASCGKYRYWNGEFCADARYRPPYVGPRW